MIKLILKSTILTLMLASTFIAIYTIKDPDESKYIAAIADKHELLKYTKAPKIVFVGGSNLAFGLNSEIIEKSLCYNVVNYGLHAGLGLKFMLNHIQPFLKKNDVVIIVPEYDNYFDNSMKEKRALYEALAEFPTGFKYVSSISEINFISIFRALQLSIQKFLRTRPFNDSYVYTRQGFNKYGDFVKHLNENIKMEKILNEGKIKFTNEIDKDLIELLNNFYLYCQLKSIKCFLSYPAIPNTNYQGNYIDTMQFHYNLKEKLKMSIISNPSNYFFHISYFYDTIYHLNSKGRTIRTQKIIADIKKNEY